MSSKRETHLESLRGLASLSVLFWHSMLGFFPEYSGILPLPNSSTVLSGSIFYGLIFGTSAVAFFFVLSGFVLTRKYLTTLNSQSLLRSVLKRWPRLAFLVGLVVVISWALFRLGLYPYREAAIISASTWLGTFGGASLGPSFSVALSKGFIGTFVRNDGAFNSSLWSIGIEFYGSFLAFAMAALLGFSKSNKTRIGIFALVIAILLGSHSPWYVSFALGVMLALYLPHYEKKLPMGWVVLALVVIIYVAGFNAQSDGIFYPLAEAHLGHLTILLWSLAATLLVYLSSVDSNLRNLLHFRIGRFLGWISFPLYLIHALVICSLGSFVLIWATHQNLPHANAIAAASSIVVSILCAIPLAKLDDWWVGVTNRFAQKHFV